MVKVQSDFWPVVVVLAVVLAFFAAALWQSVAPTVSPFLVCGPRVCWWEVRL